MTRNSILWYFAVLEVQVCSLLPLCVQDLHFPKLALHLFLLVLHFWFRVRVPHVTFSIVVHAVA